MVNHYELLCILPGTLTETDVSPAVTKIKEMVEGCGATTLTTEDMGKSRLAYPMKNIRYGYFHLINFDAEGAILSQIQRKLDLMNDLLRSFIRLSSKEKKAAYKVMLEKRALNTREVSTEIQEEKDETPTARPKQAAPPKTEVKEKERESAPIAEEKKPINIEELDKKLDALLDETVSDV